MNADKALKRPILYSNWLRKDYLHVDRARLFYGEELDEPLVLFNEVLALFFHIFRSKHKHPGSFS